MADEEPGRTQVARLTEPSGSCLVVTRPQRRQAPGHDDVLCSAEDIVMTSIVEQLQDLAVTPSER